MTNQPDTASIRERLARTGLLVAREGEDAAPISDVWRKTITALVDAVDELSGQTIVSPRDRVEALIAATSKALFDEVPAEKLSRAAWLIGNASEVMRALNNPRGARWLEIAAESNWI